MSTILGKCNNLRGDMDVIRNTKSSKAWEKSESRKGQIISSFTLWFYTKCFSRYFDWTEHYWQMKRLAILDTNLNNSRKWLRNQKWQTKNELTKKPSWYGSYCLHLIISLPFVSFNQVIQERLLYWLKSDWLFLDHSHKIFLYFFQL